MFTRDDWILFRNLATLGQKAGVPRHRLAALALKELADNALDAGAKCTVEDMGGGWYAVTDDGDGIAGTDEQIASLFSIRRPLTSTKLYRLPTRGALGNGLRVVAGAVLASGGQLRVRTRGRWLTLVPRDEGHTDVVERRASEGTDSGLHDEPGVRVEIKFGGELASDHDPLRLARVAVAMRGTSRYEGKTSPHWYDSDSFYELLQGAGAMRLGAVLDNFAGMKPGLLLRGLLLSLIQSDAGYPTRNDLCGVVKREQAERLLEALRVNCKPPKASALGEVGEGAISSHGYAKKYGEQVLKPGIGTQAATLPVVVEVWASKSTGGPSVTILINRTPVTAEAEAYSGQTGHRAETTIYGCGLRHRFKTGKAPMHLTICVTTPYMSITTDGKEPNLGPLYGVIEEAVGSACRKARQATSDGRPASKKDLIFECIPAAVSKASGNGVHRFSLRQLFYAVRPYLLNAGGEEPDYNYFCKVVAAYENEESVIRGMYRDARGIVYHPHTGETIALGTLNVERYQTPAYRFNKVLYVEKGGFFELLKDARWPERHDCALMTSQGFTTDAVRDLMDLIGKSEQEVLFFCVHDADGPGTCIYESLVEGTKNRRGVNVKVVNLGLDPAEAVRMGLAVEKVSREKGKVPVASYISEGISGWRWEDWLQSNRVELNSMTSPQFLRWLDEKMEEHDTLGKVIPPREVLAEKLAAVTEAKVRSVLTAKILADAGLDEQVKRAMRYADLPTEYDTEYEVRDGLGLDKTASWEKPLDQLAEKAAREAVA